MKIVKKFPFLLLLAVAVIPFILFSHTLKADAAGLASGTWATYGYNNQHVNRIMAPTIASGAVVKWKLNVGNSAWNYPAIGPDGTIYVNGYSTNKIFAINPASGTTKWTAGITKPYGTISVRSDGMILATNDYYLYFIRPDGTTASAKQIWSKDNETSFTGMTIADDGTLYCSSSFSMYAPAFLKKLDASGNLAWENSWLTGSFFPVSLKPDNSAVYFAQSDWLAVTPKQVVSAKPADGSQNWAANIVGNPYAWTSPIVNRDGNLIVGLDNGNLNLYDGVTGAVKWSKALGGRFENGTLAEGFDGTIYAANYSGGKLFAFDPNGNQKWVLSNLNNPQGITVVNNVIYVKSANAPLYAVSQAGSILWQTNLAGMTRVTTLMVGNDGTIYFSGSDGNFYAITGTIAVPPPTLTLTTSTPNPIASGTSTVLTLSSTPTLTLCTANSSPTSSWSPNLTVSSGAVADTSTVTLTNPSTTTPLPYNFTVNCNGQGTNPTATVSVTVNPATATPPPTVTLSANPTILANGSGSTTLSWSSTNATTCTSNSPDIAWSPTITPNTPSSQSVNLTNSNTADKIYHFTVNCNGAGGPSQAQATVTVQPPAKTITVIVSWDEKGTAQTLQFKTFLQSK